MTLKEQIMKLQTYKMYEGEDTVYVERNDVLKALEQQPCEDTISRKALLEEIENGIKAGNYEEGYEEYPHINDMDDIIECIKYADSVQPKPKTDVLDKIRAEIEAKIAEPQYQHEEEDWKVGLIMAETIIDRYKAESEERNDKRRNLTDIFRYKPRLQQ